MKDDTRNYVIVGAFVLAMLAALIGWIAVLSGRTGAIDSYYVVYDNVVGLKAGSQIFFEGYPVGVIEEIRPTAEEGRPRYRVDVSVIQNWSIPEGSQAAITAFGLLSPYVIDIQSGESAALLEPGSQIEALKAASLTDTFSSVAGSIEIVVEKIDPIAEEITEIASRISGILGKVDGVVSKENTASLSAIIQNFEKTSANVADVAGDLGETRAQVDKLLARVDRILAENEGNIESAVEDLQFTLEAVARHVEAISHNLEVTTRNMNEFSRQIRANPGVIIRGRETGDGGNP